jgi:2-C-methyl-D-erythritol 4-phosphate cytidylyltransferase / 2-C-methyl-D-erythritol 2,4-cyclodiphosphate synthase
MFVTAIIAAGGRGLRFGGGSPKQLVEVGGRAILERSVAAFLAHPAVNEVVVALPQPLTDDPPAYLRGAGKPLRIVSGGARRQDSVANAFRAADAASDVIVIHDAARPFASADLIGRTIAAAAESGAAVAAVQARDTVKRVSEGPAVREPQGRPEHRRRAADAGHYVRETIARETIYLAQTPQAFRRDVLNDALAQTIDATDEATLAERAGHAVRIVEGEASNLKITTRADLVLAEAIARSAEAFSPHPVESFGRGQRSESPERKGSSQAAPARTGRAGIGYDLHRLVEGRPLVLGGVTIPFDRGLAGHSDADAVCHAITDAVLGAAGAGDIGRHFPDTDPAWKGASSVDLLRRAVEVVRDRGYEIGNVDASVIAERPKLLPYIDGMTANVAAALGISVDRVSIKGKTNEGVGELGRGEAIAVHAIALVRSKS